MKLNIRPETAGDIDAIDAVTVAAFLAAPRAAHTEQFIIKALRAAEALSVSLVAELDGRVVGHVAASPVSISDGAAGWFGIGPISVSPEHQGGRIGSRLMQAMLRKLELRGAAGCVLVGDPAFYRRFGFSAAPDLVLANVAPQYFQMITFGGPPPRGSVRFHAAFGAQD